MKGPDGVNAGDEAAVLLTIGFLCMGDGGGFEDGDGGAPEPSEIDERRGDCAGT